MFSSRTRKTGSQITFGSHFLKLLSRFLTLWSVRRVPGDLNLAIVSGINMAAAKIRRLGSGRSRRHADRKGTYAMAIHNP